jgi:hypothetical protein
MSIKTLSGKHALAQIFWAWLPRYSWVVGLMVGLWPTWLAHSIWSIKESMKAAMMGIKSLTGKHALAKFSGPDCHDLAGWWGWWWIYAILCWQTLFCQSRKEAMMGIKSLTGKHALGQIFWAWLPRNSWVVGLMGMLCHTRFAHSLLPIKASSNYEHLEFNWKTRAGSNFLGLTAEI